MGSLTPLCMVGDMVMNWRKFKRQFITFIDTYYETASESRKVALLHLAGDDAAEVFESFQLKDEDKKKLKMVLQNSTNILYQQQT